MADVEVQMQFTTTERKVRKVKKTSKRRESTDNSDVTITEIEKENHITNDHGYVLVIGLNNNAKETIALLHIERILDPRHGHFR
jgi:hypothetical protein